MTQAMAHRDGGARTAARRGRAPAGHDGRIDWVDYAKGFCIVFVVLMHATFGVEAALGREGWLHPVVEFMTPFRIPDFFLLSGLFVGRVIDRDWRTYLDRKVVHFLYFLVLWSGHRLPGQGPAVRRTPRWPSCRWRW